MVTRQDAMLMEEVLSVPATYANGILVTPYQSPNSAHVRLTFYESHPATDVHCRCAVIMSMDELQQIKQAIDMALESFKPKTEEQKDAVLQ